MVSTSSAWLHGWTVDPVVLVVACAGVVLYARGRRTLINRSRTSSGDTEPAGRHNSVDGSGWRLTAFFAAIGTFLVAACSPIDWYAGSLFWVHMIQHLVLIVVFAPLLVLSAPALPIWAGLPEASQGALRSAAAAVWRGPIPRVVKFFSRPVPCFALFLGGTWAWHWPPLYDLALNNEVLHDYGEHNTFILVALLFWLQIIPSAPFRPMLRTIGRIAYIGAAVAQNVVLSVIIGFAPGALYTPYAHLAHRPGGISALADQQLGAAIMWSVGDLPFVIALSVIVQLWLKVSMQGDGPAEGAEPHNRIGYPA